MRRVGVGHTDEIRYRVPLSCVRVTATVTEVDDSILTTASQRTVEASISLEVIGGEPLTARIDSNFLQDTNVSFSMTDDGVLVSGSVDSTGEAGKVLLAAVSVGATVAGIATGAPVAGGMVAAAAGAAALRAGGAAGWNNLLQLLPAHPVKPVDPVVAAFAVASPDVYSMRVRYAQLEEGLQAEVADALDQLSDSDETTDRYEISERLRSAQVALGVARAESAKLDTVFNAWRATTITTRTETYEILMTLDELRRSGARIGPDDRPAFGAGGKRSPAAGKARRLWRDLGIVVVLEERKGEEHPADEPSLHNKITVRSPRRVTLSLFKKDEASVAAKLPFDKAKAVLIESKPHLVMDGLCDLQTITFRKSILAKRTGSFTFSALGTLTGFSTTRTASAAALADTAQALPGTAAAGLEQAKKLSDDASALRNRSIDARLAELKNEVAIKQQEISLAGLHATEAQAAELERLKQQEQILKEQQAISGYTKPAGG